MLCDTAAPLRAQKECTYKRMHPRHGSGAVNVSRNTGIETCCLVERRTPREKAWSRELQETLVSSRSRRNEAVDQWVRSSSDQAWVSTGVEQGGEHRVPTAKPEEQMAAAIQQLNVRLQQPGTIAPILQAERGDLTSQVQSATSTTTQKLPGVVDTRVIGRPDEFDRSDEVHGLVVQTENILRSCGLAVSAVVEDDRSSVNTETRREAQLRGELPQQTDVLHTRDDNDRIGIGQVSVQA